MNIAILNGKLLWVWELPQTHDIETTVQLAKIMKVDGLVIKAFDGSNVWDQFEQSVQYVKNNGLKCGAWGYVYPSQVDQEIEAVKQVMQHNPDFMVLDAEIEFDSTFSDSSESIATKHTAASQLVDGLKNIVNVPIGLTTFAFIHDHPLFPYKTFMDKLDFIVPQIYWADMGLPPGYALNSSLQQLSPINKPIFPIGQGYSPATAVDILQFGTACVEKSIESVSFWSAQALYTDDSLKQAVAEVDIYVPIKPHKDKPVQESITAKQKEMLNNAIDLIKSVIDS